MKSYEERYDVILHIGAPKTGSSALQHFLFLNRELLLEKGIYYPRHGFDVNGISGGHSGIGASLIEGDVSKSQSILDRYVSESRKKGLTLLVSAESLFGYPKQVKKLCSGLNVGVISFYRDPLESIISGYNQSVKRHYNTSTLDSYCLKILGVGSRGASGMMLYDWSESFGRDNLMVLEYKKPVNADSVLERQLLAQLGVSESEFADFEYNKKPINRGYEPVALEFKRLLNVILNPHHKPDNQKIDYLLQEVSDSHSNEIQNNASYLSEVTYQALTEEFGCIANKIRHDFMSGGVASKNEVIFQPLEAVDQANLLMYASAIMSKDSSSHTYILRCLEVSKDLSQDVNVLKVIYSTLK
ncbi:hypothetical protein [Leucothrix mucor]|uniref:hypothetical protein n=1 Tax=Leucothrix mucor TaxID=45248 RepID=UPI0003B42087|nr:hypothetical protein [Leucothrix mucor]